MNKAIMIDVERCLGCRSCEIACAVAHSESGILEQAIKERPKPQKRVTVQAVGAFGVPLQCRHCKDAPCITVCPTKAIRRKQAQDPVLIEQDLCIGCAFCCFVCPFGVISISDDGRAVTKCDFCIDRIIAGQEPACVEACPTRALRLVDEDELAASKRKLAAELVISTQKNNTKEKQKENKQ